MLINSPYICIQNTHLVQSNITEKLFGPICVYMELTVTGEITRHYYECSVIILFLRQNVIQTKQAPCNHSGLMTLYTN